MRLSGRADCLLNGKCFRFDKINKTPFKDLEEGNGSGGGEVDFLKGIWKAEVITI